MRAAATFIVRVLSRLTANAFMKMWLRHSPLLFSTLF
jgi:hypothetical protein